MPSLFFADLVRETSVSTGAGPLRLDGATPGHRRFADVVPVAAQFHYAIHGVTQEEEWEVGFGTLDAGGQLLRSPLASSNGGAATLFSEGLKLVALTVGASWFAARDNLAGHDHPVAAITGLQAALDGKQPLSTGHGNAAGFLGSDQVTVRRGTGWVNVPASQLVLGDGTGAYQVAGRLTGGFGAETNIGTQDWNHVSNARSGSGQALLASSALNGPPNGHQMHSFCFEYGAGKDGNGNMTQFAIPHLTGSGFYGFRHRLNGSWSTWRAILYENGNDILPSADNGKALGSAARRFSTVYAGSGAINTSDARMKEEVGALPDAWLDAWGDAQWARYKFTGGRRWHIGLIAQAVHGAFAAHGLDAFEIGLCCYDRWQDDAGQDADRWGLRYDECFALEAAWQRRELARLKAQVAGYAAGQGA